MAEANPHSWTCPSCGRRVPVRVEACHCGMTRARAEQVGGAQPPEAAAPRVVRGLSDRRAAMNAMTGDVKLLLVTSGLVFVLGLGWLAFGPRSKPYPPVLGYVDAGPPTAAQAAGLRHPPFKLPWWK